jgi:hypothetical protein
VVAVVCSFGFAVAATEGSDSAGFAVFSSDVIRFGARGWLTVASSLPVACTQRPSVAIGDGSRTRYRRRK